ncbi:MAG: DUF4159 domain-containing protein [Kiritimatiellae bacterium]|nr:DUF4159 domain-containing protein [Kiritimatiellia bacterium]
MTALTFARTFAAAAIALACASKSDAQMLFPGDGSDEPGFVPPVVGDLPPPPPARMSSGESYIPYPPPPVVPQARSEKKNPPTPPVMFTKLRSPHGMLDWATRPDDLNNLLREMKSSMDVHLACEVKSLEEVDPNPERNPILFRSGHFRIRHTPAERARLRQYLLAGGMIIYDAAAGSKPFYDSAVAELRETFPEVPVQRLGPDHPIFHAYYDLDRVDYRAGVRAAGYHDQTPWFDGVTINCRVVAVVSRWGLGIGWDGNTDDSLRAYTVDSARKLGVNLMAYATAQRAWARQFAHALQFVDREPSSVGRISIAQIVYDGEWKTRHKGLSVLLQQFHQKTGVPVKFAVREIRLSDPSLFDSPLLYLTGHEEFRLSEVEVRNLREYLRRGGFLFSEACCGRAAFDQALRRELRRALPESTLTTIPTGDPLLTLPNRIETVGLTPALAQRLSRSRAEPRLEGIILDGHLAVVHSPWGLAGGWELSPNPYALALDESSSLAVGINVLMAALTQ